MKIGYIGLGKMGANMTRFLLERGHRVVAYDISKERVLELTGEGADGAFSLEEFVSKLEAPRVIWIMVQRDAVESVLGDLKPLLGRGDTIIEGGNTFYKDTIRRARDIEERGIGYLDVGVSGGVRGARHGACMMIGGRRDLFEKNEELFRDLTVPDGYGYLGNSGAGHFVKMVHNGIEYGMMGAIGEGMQAIYKYQKEFGADLAEAIKVYGHGSIISSRLMDWLSDAWKEEPYLLSVKGEVPYGETEEEMEALEKLAEMPVLESARLARVQTRKSPSFAGAVMSALRNQFGGHAVKKK